MRPLTSEMPTLVQRAEEGDGEALGRAFDEYRTRLRRMVQVRLDPRLRRRIDPSDVIQEAWLEVARQNRRDQRPRQASFFVWLRLVVGQCILAVERRHLGAQARDARREVSGVGGTPSVSTDLVATIVAGGPSARGELARDETRRRIRQALLHMDPLDREVLVMRHYEDLSNVEVAEELGIQATAVRQRYVRAARRLRHLLKDLDGDDGPAAG